MPITRELVEFNLEKLPQIVFEVTDACNLRCKYCAYSDLYSGYEPRHNSMMTFAVGKQVLHYFENIWNKKSNSYLNYPLTIGFYGGEPLMNFPFIKQMVEYLGRVDYLGRVISFNMTTNALLLDKYMDFLVMNNFRLLISLDGDLDSQSLRVDALGRNSYNKVINNVFLLKERYPEYFERNVQFNAVLHKMNSVEGIYNFFTSTFNKIPSIAPLSTSGIRPDKREEFIDTYKNYADSISSSLNCADLEENLFIKNPQTYNVLNYLFFRTNNVFNSYNDLILGLGQNHILETGTCTPFSKKLFVTVNGKLHQCERISHKYSCGYVNENEMVLDVEKVVEQYNYYTSKFSHLCQRCGNNHSCIQCVYQIDDIDEHAVKCAGFCTPAQKEIQLNLTKQHLMLHPELYERILNNVIIQ